DALALASRGVEVAEDQDVAFPVREANEPAHAAVGTILASIGKSIDDPPAGPRGAAVLGHRGAAARRPLRFGPVDARVVVDATVRELGDRCLARPVLRKGVARAPGASAVVAIDRRRIVVRPFRSVVAAGVEPRG